VNPSGHRERPIVAIDGPAGAGKSTVAAYLARTFGYLNLETGAMYRALALKAIESDVDLDDEESLATLVLTTRIQLSPSREGNRVLLDSIDVTRRVRDEDVTAGASRVSVHPRVRRWMVDQQRTLGMAGGVVMEGRDIGTAVFPDAEIKIFLDAAPQVRGSRRYQQVSLSASTERSGTTAARDHAASSSAEQAEVERDLQERDERDRNRAESPLRAAQDAILIDSTSMTLTEVLAQAEQIVRRYVDAFQPCGTPVSSV
jgi:cytidylate kinase